MIESCGVSVAFKCFRTKTLTTDWYALLFSAISGCSYDIFDDPGNMDMNQAGRAQFIPSTSVELTLFQRVLKAVLLVCSKFIKAFFLYVPV